MNTEKIQRLNGRFVNPDTEQAYLRFAWPVIRLQSALTIGGLCLGLLVALMLVDLPYVVGTQIHFTVFAARLIPMITGLGLAVWFLLGRPSQSQLLARLAPPAWLMIFLAGSVTIAAVYTDLETTPQGLTDLLVFTSFWMSILTIVVGFGLHAWIWPVFAFCGGMAAGYLGLAAYWSSATVFPLVAQSIIMVMAAAFAWIMALVSNIRARRLFHVTRLYKTARESAEASQSLYAFLLGAVGHDVRQPIYALNLNAELLARKAESGDLDGVKAAAKRQSGMAKSLNQMLGSILEVSSDPDGHVEPERVDVSQLFAEVCAPVQEAARARNIEIRIARQSGHIRINRGAAVHIISNAVSNAIAHSGGSRILLGLRYRNGQPVIQVMDNGRGMGDVPLRLQTVDDVLTQAPASRSGSGFGLGIMFRLAERENLPLSVYSVPDKGVRVTLYCHAK